jgi:hypothetical protein
VAGVSAHATEPRINDGTILPRLKFLLSLTKATPRKTEIPELHPAA